MIGQLKGHISVTSSPSEGTCFDVFLPQLEADASGDDVAPDYSPAGGSERIMVVDDEISILAMLEEVLEEGGYTVAAFEDSSMALEAFYRNPEKVDLVITDYTMHGLTGTDLARKMMEINRQLPVILCTGYSDAINEQKASALGIKAFFMKPVVPGQLMSATRRLLDEGKGQATDS
jgi:DNA-binding NtrC family response regulator